MKNCARGLFLISLAAILVSCQGLAALQPTQEIAGGSATPMAVSSTKTAITTSNPRPTQPPPAPGTPLPPSPSPAASPSAPPDCERAAPGSPIDLSVPDDTLFQPGEPFTKTWRLLNSSDCTWTSDYAAVWFSGEKFGAPTTIYLPGKVSPGDAVDISVDMAAPKKSGTYQSNWKLQSPDGKLFGIGPNGNSPFWVRIAVSQPKGTESENAATPTAVPQIYANGLASLAIDDGLDLDLLKLNQGKSDDLVYHMSNQKPELAPQNGALLALMGKSQPSMADCQAARLGSEAITLDGLSSGTYLCDKTNLGLPGWTRIVYLNTQNNDLTLEILTWSIP